MNKNNKYITENYIEWNKLCSLSNISSQKLEDLIQKELVPNASYTINTTNEISSSLQDKIIIKETKRYFSKNIVELIQKNKTLKNSSRFKEHFKTEFRNTLEKNPDKKYAYDNIFKEDETIDENKLNLIFEQEWKHYCDGVYGICTLNASAFDISHKEVAVKKLIDFNKKHKDNILNKKEKRILKKLNTEFNAVSNVFAPYQRENSSRGKYLDKILKLNSLDELIIKYP